MKKFGIIGTILLCLCAVLYASDGATVTVEVQLVRADNKQPLKDSGKVAIWLEPVGKPFNPVSEDDAHFKMSQKDKHFVPDMLVVPVGSYVDFPNQDPWFHNVFSLFRGKRFDLGLYQAGAQKSVRFDRPGVAYLFCNIHPEMGAVILAVNSHSYGISVESGKVTITGVPPGKYVVHVWHQDASAEALNNLRRTEEIERDVSLGSIIIPVNPNAKHEHKNKYGQDYDKDPLKTDY